MGRFLNEHISYRSNIISIKNISLHVRAFLCFCFCLDVSFEIDNLTFKRHKNEREKKNGKFNKQNILKRLETNLETRQMHPIITFHELMKAQHKSKNLK